jgi:hypothetical protein
MDNVEESKYNLDITTAWILNMRRRWDWPRDSDYIETETSDRYRYKYLREGEPNNNKRTMHIIFPGRSSMQLDYYSSSSVARVRCGNYEGTFMLEENTGKLLWNGWKGD